MHNIQIDVLSPKSIDKAIQELRAYEQGLKDALQVAIARLANIGVNVMRAQFDIVAALNHGIDESPTIMVEHTPDGMLVKAYGEKLCFLEFGTGDLTHTSHEGATNVPFSVAPGSWSQGPDGQKQYPPGWWYNGEYYTGTMAADAFPEAMAEIRRQAADIVRDTIQTWI